MGENKIHILCPEYVPLENKGEEAIIRGTVDVIFEKDAANCEYHIVDMNIDNYRFVNGLHVHPGKLFFSDWRSREFGLGPSLDQIYSSLCSLLRNFLNKFFPFWIRKPHKQAKNLKKYLSGKKLPPKKYEKSVEELKKVEFVIAGHNGGLDEYVCHLLNEFNDINIPYGIFGSSMKPNIKQKELLRVFEKSFSNSLFNIARNPIGYRWALENFTQLEFDLNPDPAFGMIPGSVEETKNVIKDNSLELFFEKKVIMFTTAEPAPIARHSFENQISSSQKINAHREFLAGLLKLIHDNYDVNIIFLPHTIGPNSQMDDRKISEDVINRAGLKNSSRVKLLESDLSAKQLKGLINKAQFLIAERVHSIIGAIGVNTPFLCLASDKDTRVKGIIKEQMKLQDLVYSLKTPEVDLAFNKFKALYENTDSVVLRLKNLNLEIESTLRPTGKRLKYIIEKSTR